MRTIGRVYINWTKPQEWGSRTVKITYGGEKLDRELRGSPQEMVAEILRCLAEEQGVRPRAVVHVGAVPQGVLDA